MSTQHAVEVAEMGAPWKPLPFTRGGLMAVLRYLVHDVDQSPPFCRSIAILVLALSTEAAMAQKVDRPDIEVGNRWQFVEYYTVPSTVPGRSWVITAVTPTSIEGTENDEPLKLTRELNILESPRTRSTNPKALDFPLEIGRRWHYVSDWLYKPKGSSGSVAVDVAVLGYEKVTVPAGEFDAFKLVAREALSGTSPINSQYAGEITRTYWYAPAARAIVKTVSHNPYLGSSTVELVTFDLRRSERQPRAIPR